MKKLIFIIAIISFILWITCQQNNKQGNGHNVTQQKEHAKEEMSFEDSLIKRGLVITKKVQTNLSFALSKAIDAGGISQAIQYCSINALSITDSIAKTENIKIKRVTHKARNPYNKADEQEMKIMQEYITAISEGKEIVPTIRDENNYYTFYNPIIINNQLCINCHGNPGTDITSKDFIIINLAYPEDKATGFKMGDIRGMWRIDFSENEPII